MRISTIHHCSRDLSRNNGATLPGGRPLRPNDRRVRFPFFPHSARTNKGRRLLSALGEIYTTIAAIQLSEAYRRIAPARHFTVQIQIQTSCCCRCCSSSMRETNNNATLSVNPCYGEGVIGYEERRRLAVHWSLVGSRGSNVPALAYNLAADARGDIPRGSRNPGEENVKEERKKKRVPRVIIRGGRGRGWPAYHVLTHAHTHTHTCTLGGEKKVDTRRRTRRGPRSDRVEGRYSTAAAREAHPPPRPLPAYFPDPFTPPPCLDSYHHYHVAL